MVVRWWCVCAQERERLRRTGSVDIERREGWEGKEEEKAGGGMEVRRNADRISERNEKAAKT